jgi:uracil-DNA glycosylase
VFGEGPSDARILLAGEQPGDVEDREGRPFVGPAGRVLDDALAAVGLDRRRVFLTNVVKHFRWEMQRGKKRIHRKPGLAHVRSCEPWFREELRVVDPEVVVLLGATAAQAVLGPGARVTELRGRPVSAPLDAVVVVTVHPSSILRTRDHDAKREAFEALVEDLRVAVHAMS